jgi:valyl-tRNA synthetase
MSKSLGNSPDPIELMDKYGADGVRMGMLLTSPAGNDLPFDEILCEQGRNFNNKIWNAFRLVKGWEVADIPQPDSAAIAIRWFEAKLSLTIENLNDLFTKYRISEALMEVYKLFWDEFSSWYLEIIKPAYQQPVDLMTYNTTLKFFDALLRLLHPFLPFITEELWQSLEERNEGESIMISLMPDAENTFKCDGKTNNAMIDIEQMEETKEIIANIRTIRAQKNIPNKENLRLQVIGEYQSDYYPVLLKMANLSGIEKAVDKTAGAISFLVKTTEFAVPIGSNNINVAEELAKLKEELKYQQEFLETILEKLNTESFVSKAPQKIIDMEHKKQADTESKIKSLQESIIALK